MTDKVKNYYEMLPKDLKQERKVDANFKKHYIQPCSMICCIGGTGSGKTNCLIDFLNSKNNAFYDIIIFSGSTVEEPLYNLLKQKMPEIRLFNNIEEFPSLSEFDDENKDQEKLVVLDDVVYADVIIQFKHDDVIQISDHHFWDACVILGHAPNSEAKFTACC